MANENSFKAAAEAKKQAKLMREKAEREAAEREAAEREAAKKAAQEAEAGETAADDTAADNLMTPVAENPKGPQDIHTGNNLAENETPELRSAREAIVSSYAAKIKGKIEPQKERIQVATTKTIKDQLKALEKEKKIKSMNHLINSLLKMYLGMEDD